jgi:hypothetical protein
MNNNQTRNNFFSLSNESFIKTNSKNIENITKTLNQDKLIIVSWMKNIWKLNLIKELINKTDIKNSYYYFNKSDDIENKLNSNLDLLKSLNEYVQLYKIPKIIILQNTSKIDWIKDFISYLYKQKYKVILLWNDIKISWIKEIEIITNPSINTNNINITIKYWSLLIIKDIENIDLIEKILKLITNDIFLNSIFKDFWVKSIELYNYTITYLSKNNIFLSLRDIHKNIDKINKISLKTTIDYIDFSLQSKIIKRCYKYDLKNKKEISSKAKYYFTDNWVRNSLNNFKLKKDILIENLIFNILEYNKYTIYWGLNWKFDFSFFWNKKWENIFIHISKETKKEEIKKEINKLNKISKEWNKYLLVESIAKLGIKKIRYDDVEIIEVNEFLEKFGNK